MCSNRSSLSFLILFSVLWLSLPVFSQNKEKADSLIRILNNIDLSHLERTKTLRYIAYYHPDVNSGLTYAKESLLLAKKLDNPILQAEAWEELAHLEGRLGNIDKSLEASLNALKIYEREGLEQRVAASYNQLAANHMMNENYPTAIKYLKRAEVIYENSNQDENLANTILNLGEAYRLSNNLDSAEISFKRTLELNQEINSNITEGYSLGNLGMVYHSLDELSNAKANLTHAITILLQLGDYYSTSVYMTELASIYEEEGRMDLAEKNYLEAMDMAKKTGYKEQVRNFSEKLTQFYENGNKFVEALQFQKIFQIYQDSLVNKANIQKIERVKAAYEIDKRELEIGLLNQVNTNQKYLLWALVGGVVATLAFLYLLYKGNRKVKKANTILFEQKEIISEREKEKALLLRELNHRVKNNLQMISSLLSLQSRELDGHPAKEALETGKDRVEALSLIHRKLYQEDAETRVDLKEYLEELVLGLFHGYNAHFKPKLELADINISVDTLVPLALIINEMVVNALKYAYNGLDHPSLTLKVQEVDSNLTIQVIDNGKGFILSDSGKKGSFGLKLIQSLVEQLEGTLTKKDDRGTHWQVQLSIV